LGSAPIGRTAIITWHAIYLVLYGMAAVTAVVALGLTLAMWWAISVRRRVVHRRWIRVGLASQAAYVLYLVPTIARVVSQARPSWPAYLATRGVLDIALILNVVSLVTLLQVLRTDRNFQDGYEQEG
jgi:hypothetical protein